MAVIQFFFQARNFKLKAKHQYIPQLVDGVRHHQERHQDGQSQSFSCKETLAEVRAGNQVR